VKLTIEQIKQAIEVCGYDGHTVWKKEDFAFLPRQFIDSILTDCEDVVSQYSIFGSEDTITKANCIYGLQLLWCIADDINANTTIAQTKKGRGFQAQALTKSILIKINELEAKKSEL